MDMVSILNITKPVDIFPYLVSTSAENREQHIVNDFFSRFRKWSNIIDGMFTTNNQRTSLGDTFVNIVLSFHQCNNFQGREFVGKRMFNRQREYPSVISKRKKIRTKNSRA